MAPLHRLVILKTLQSPVFLGLHKRFVFGQICIYSRGLTDITELGYKSSSTKIMPIGSVLFTSRAPIGYVAIAAEEVSTNQGFKSIVPLKTVPSEFLYLLLKRLVPIIERNAGGTTFKEISTSGISKIKIIKPSELILKKFEKK
ncbi:restriction endonuclease subunit S [Planococcus sp. MB-3u-03]|uniref:restriction endonuclease subunit S n=1 Tax=Planococcus sp. MB-3u-03 TaxID=2058136 RepID=UPI001E6050E7|nr:restriction endonuclease subunit S [Planococcus sp. MB-3u-03]